MSKLLQVKARNLITVVTKLGFKFRDQSGSHAVYIHPDGRRTTIPIHPSQTIGVGLLIFLSNLDINPSLPQLYQLVVA